MAGRYGGGGGFMAGPGSLEGSWNAGRANMESRGKYNSDMATAELQRMLSQAEGARAEQMHPLKMQDAESVIAGRDAQTADVKQGTILDKEKGDREAEKHNTDQADAMVKSYGAIAAEVDALPPGLRMDYLNKRLGDNAEGRKLYDALNTGIQSGKTNPNELGAGFRKMAEQIHTTSREYLQAKKVAEIGADSRLDAAETRATAQIGAANIRADAAQTAAGIRAAAGVTQAEIRAEAARVAAQGRNDAAMARIERQAQLRLELEKAKADAKGDKGDGKGGGGGVKTFQALAAQLEQAAINEPDPVRRAAIQKDADDAFNRAAALKGAGVQQGDPQVITRPDGGVGIGTVSRQPGPPPRGGAAAPANKPGDAIPKVKSVEEARALPKGTKFMSPDGKIRIVP